MLQFKLSPDALNAKVVEALLEVDLSDVRCAKAEEIFIEQESPTLATPLQN